MNASAVFGLSHLAATYLTVADSPRYKFVFICHGWISSSQRRRNCSTPDVISQVLIPLSLLLFPIQDRGPVLSQLIPHSSPGNCTAGQKVKKKKIEIEIKNKSPPGNRVSANLWILSSCAATS